MPYTPDFLTVNGLAISATAVGRKPDDPEAWGRGGGLTYEGTTYDEKDEFDFETPPLTPQKADSYTGWVKGVGHYWNFNYTDGATTRFTAYSTECGMAWLPSTSYTASSNAKFGRWGMMLHSSQFVVATAAFGVEEPGLSISGWKRTVAEANAWELCSVIYDGATTKYVVGSTGVTSAFNWLAFSFTIGFLNTRIQGEGSAGSPMTTLYDGWMMLPYSLTTEQLAARVARTSAEPDFPYVAVGGKFPRTDVEVTCKGFITDRSPERVTIDGVNYSNAEVLIGRLVER